MTAKALRHAQEESIAAAFANVAQAIMTVYYQIQMQIWSIRILKFYIDEVKRLVDYLQHCANKDKKSTREDIAVLKNIAAKFKYDLAFIDSLSIDLPILSSLVGFDPNLDWADLKIEEHVIKPVPTEPAKYQQYWTIAQLLSPEIKNVEYLIDAAHEQKRSVYFQFIDPLYSTTFGFGYGYRIKIARSNLKLLDISKKRTRIQLSIAIQNALNNYNDSISALPAMQDALGQLVDMKPLVENHVNDFNTPLDINRVARFFEYASGQALRYISSYFVFRGSEADLNRYTWNGDIYDLVNYYRRHKISEFLKQAKKQHSFRNHLKTKWKKCCHHSNSR